MLKETITICGQHDEQIPLIPTFAFPGAEYWCPACGHTYGMFEAPTVEATEGLKISKEEWKKKGDEFLNAKSTLSCSSLTYQGKTIKPSELPQEVLTKLKQTISDYKYELSE